MPDHTGYRPVQVTIHADDVDQTVHFYTNVFDVEFDKSVSSFTFGPDTDSYFVLTVEPQTDEHPGYPGRGACFGLLVDDLETVHQRALDAGGTEVHPPMDFAWKPRASLVDDPSGNRLALYQA